MRGLQKSYGLKPLLVSNVEGSAWVDLTSCFVSFEVVGIGVNGTNMGFFMTIPSQPCGIHSPRKKETVTESLKRVKTTCGSN